jgi:uncharacterized protein (TIGR00369 family)
MPASGTASQGPALTPTEPNPPPGFRLCPPHPVPVFNEHIGPLFVRAEGEGIAFGLRVALRHCNSAETCHGGMLVSFADVAMTAGGNYLARLGRFFSTISLTSDFIAPAPLGAWIEARPQLLKVTRSMAFVHCMVTLDDAPVLRTSGTFRHGGEPDARFDRLRAYLEG